MNEPVAWGNQNTFCKYCHRIPSQCGCTHPVKELTAQEVMEQTHKKISEAHWKVKELTDEEIIKVYESMLGFVSKQESAINFARAILRKAQENDKLNPSTINIGGVIYQSGKEVK